MAIEREGFGASIEESPLTLDDLIAKAPRNWRLDAQASTLRKLSH